ncbi:MAG: DUF4126 domain-containing protein [Acidobacteria bacterium]|nr:DUF4126 domain-containing protein [Acidobacteriota bacterium]
MTASLTSLSGLLGLSFASGVNLYAAILVVGLGLRYEWLTGLPKELTPLAHPAVLIAAGLLYTVEFFADKIPFVSAAWDTLHTFIRPIGAAIMALTAASQLGPVEQTLVALTGGAVALASHGTKMGVRLLAHGTGEPFTQAAMSTAEDVFAVTLVLLVSQHPYIALGIVIVLLIAIAFIVPLIWKALSAIFRRIARWFNPDVARGSSPARN